MFFDMKIMVIVPLVVAIARANHEEDYIGSSHCKAISEIHGRDGQNGTIRYLDTDSLLVPSTIQLIMSFEIPSDDAVTYAALAFHANDITEDCTASGSAVAKTVSYQGVKITPRSSVTVAWMTPASLLPGSEHNIVGLIVAVYRLDKSAGIPSSHFLKNHHDYRPIGCGEIHAADCDDDVTSIVSSMGQEETADEPNSAYEQPSKEIWAHAKEDKLNDEVLSAEHSKDAVKSAEEHPDTPGSGEESHDAPVPVEQSGDPVGSPEQQDEVVASPEQPDGPVVLPEKRHDTAVPAPHRPKKTFLRRISLQLKGFFKKLSTQIEVQAKKFWAWLKPKHKRTA